MRLALPPLLVVLALLLPLGAAAREDAVSVVRRHYALLNDGDLQGAYMLRSATARRKLSLATFRQNWQTCRSVGFYEGPREVSNDGHTAVVQYRIGSCDTHKDMFERGEADRLRLAVVFDEAHRAARLQLLGTMMQESRKFGIMMVVSSQRAGDFHPRVIESTGNFLLLKVNPPDARTLAPILAGYEGKDLVMRKLIDQPSYHALFRNEGWRPYVEVALQDPQAER